MRRVDAKDGSHVFNQPEALQGGARQWFATAAVCALIVTALWYPKTPRERPVPAAQAEPAPSAHALIDRPAMPVEVTLHPESAPVFYAVCHRYRATPAGETSYAVDYASCPVKRTQVRDTDQIALDLPPDTDSVLVEVWPLNRVEPARYIITTPTALERDGLWLR